MNTPSTSLKLQSAVSLISLLTISASLGTGCTTMKVTKVDPNEPTPGRVYSLPKVFLEVKTVKGGGIEVVPVLYPDPDHTYGIQTRSKLAKHETTIEVKNGFLESLKWKPDSTDVVKDAIAKAAEVAGQIADAKIEEEKKTKETKEEAIEVATALVTTAQGKVDQARIAVIGAEEAIIADEGSIRVAEEQLALYQAQEQPDAAIILQRQLELISKRNELETKRRALVRKQQELADAEIKLQTAESKLNVAKGIPVLLDDKSDAAAFDLAGSTFNLPHGSVVSNQSGLPAAANAPSSDVADISIRSGGNTNSEPNLAPVRGTQPDDPNGNTSISESNDSPTTPQKPTDLTGNPPSETSPGAAAPGPKRHLSPSETKGSNTFPYKFNYQKIWGGMLFVVNEGYDMAKAYDAKTAADFRDLPRKLQLEVVKFEGSDFGQETIKSPSYKKLTPPAKVTPKPKPKLTVAVGIVLNRPESRPEIRALQLAREEAILIHKILNENQGKDTEIRQAFVKAEKATLKHASALKIAKAEDLSFTLTSDKDLNSILDQPTLKRVYPTESSVDNKSFAYLTTPKTVKVNIQNDIDEGVYELTASFEYGSAKVPKVFLKKVQFEVR